MRARVRRFTLFIALSLAACGGDSNANDLDAATSRDMSTASEDAALVDGAALSDGSLLDANMSSDSSADAASSGCTSDEMCADPIRERCNVTAGACEDRPQWAITTIQYEDGAERVLENVRFADAAIFSSSGDGSLRFQQGDGRTSWILTIASSTEAGVSSLGRISVGSSSIYIGEGDPSLPMRHRRGWQSVSGTMNLVSCSIAENGVVEGRLSAIVEAMDDPSIHGEIRASFKAVFLP